jgi:hypothetical protein
LSNDRASCWPSRSRTLGGRAHGTGAAVGPAGGP